MGGGFFGIRGGIFRFLLFKVYFEFILMNFEFL